jgi:hypothetical protein
VTLAVAFRTLRRAADALARPEWRQWSYDVALSAMWRLRMDEDRHGVVTRRLTWMEATWDEAYLWENAEVVQAYLEASLERGDGEVCKELCAGNRERQMQRTCRETCFGGSRHLRSAGTLLCPDRGALHLSGEALSGVSWPASGRA